MVIIRCVFLLEQQKLYRFPVSLFDNVHRGSQTIQQFAFKRMKFIEVFAQIEQGSRAVINSMKGRIVHFDKYGVVLDCATS